MGGSELLLELKDSAAIRNALSNPLIMGPLLGFERFPPFGGGFMQFMQLIPRAHLARGLLALKGGANFAQPSILEKSV
jgi:hypothetical protein